MAAPCQPLIPPCHSERSEPAAAGRLQIVALESLPIPTGFFAPSLLAIARRDSAQNDMVEPSAPRARGRRGDCPYNPT